MLSTKGVEKVRLQHGCEMDGTIGSHAEGDSEMGVRAAAATVLAHDPDLGAAAALADASGDPSWHVRVAAIDAIAECSDPY